MKKIMILLLFSMFIVPLFACGASSSDETNDAIMQDVVQTENSSVDSNTSEKKDANDEIESQAIEKKEIRSESEEAKNSIPDMVDEKEETMMIEGMEEKKSSFIST